LAAIVIVYSVGLIDPAEFVLIRNIHLGPHGQIGDQVRALAAEHRPKRARTGYVSSQRR
jgi:hypothetical protein